jgi:hypothetical protein
MVKIDQFLGKVAKTVVKPKYNIKAESESPKHLPLSTFETF